MYYSSTDRENSNSRWNNRLVTRLDLDKLEGGILDKWQKLGAF